MAKPSTTESQKKKKKPEESFVDSCRLVRDFEEQWVDGAGNLTPAFVGFMGAMRACHVKSDNGVVFHYELFDERAHGSSGAGAGRRIEWLGSGGELARGLRQQAGAWQHGAPKCYREDKAGFCGVVFYFGPQQHAPADLATAMEDDARALSFHIDMDFRS